MSGVLAHTVAFGANLFTSKIVSTAAGGVSPIHSDRGASNCGKIAYPTKATDLSKLEVETAQVE